MDSHGTSLRSSYTEQDARNALKLLRRLPFDAEQSIDDSVQIVLRRAGHILGAASIQVKTEGLTTVFSGDIGRYGDPIMPESGTSHGCRLPHRLVDLWRQNP